jgi:branched-chain amino acid transport system permease protein
MNATQGTATTPSRRPTWQGLALTILVVVGIWAGSRLAPEFFNQYRLLMLCFGVVYAMAALPLNLLMGHAGQISLGHAAFLGVGAFTGGAVAGRLGLPFVTALIIAAAVGGIIALGVGVPALRIRGLFLALVTLGFGLALSSFVFRIPAVTGGYAGTAVPRPQIGTYVLRSNADLFVLFSLLFAAVWLLDRRVLRTTVGRSFRALKDNEDVAASLGVDVTAAKLQAFVLYGAGTAVAGLCLATTIGFAQIEVFTFDLSLLFVVIVVAGGLGSKVGVALAAAAFAILPRWMQWLEGWELVLGPAVLLQALVRHPDGLGALLHRPAASRPQSTDEQPRRIELPRAPRPEGQRPGQLEVDRIEVTFGGLRALDKLSLDVPPGQITGLIGPNGAGKTTLLQVISGFVTPRAGNVRLDDRELTGLAPHERTVAGLGRTFQNVGLIPSLSVRENILLAQHTAADYGRWTALLPLPKVATAERELHHKAAAVLAGLGLADEADRPLGHLSHGQQRIVELAAVLLSSPRVLLLDEPTAGLSPAAVEALAASIRQLRDEGQTILLVEHHLPFVRATCDLVHVLDAGRHLVTGSPEQVQRDPLVISAYLGTTEERPHALDR